MSDPPREPLLLAITEQGRQIALLTEQVALLVQSVVLLLGEETGAPIQEDGQEVDAPRTDMDDNPY
ncbi:hypothetical protein [Stenotrophomonas rhizophila]|uniref:hypothetical protein n=1 Tax=Stenotrophomonas rhizophila TaxID=216778 RepID=UPI0028A9C310|nr:hypothetical protein [Stenotrophomonas rhizophila]